MRKVFKLSQENAVAAAQAEMFAQANRPNPEIQRLAASIAEAGTTVPPKAASDPFQLYKKVRVSMVEARPSQVPWLMAELQKELPAMPAQADYEPFIPGDRAFESIEMAAPKDIPEAQPQRTIADVKPAVPRLSPSEPKVLASKGHELVLQAKWEQARVALDRALDGDDSIAEAHNDLGIVLAYLGDRQGALEHFEAVNEPAAAHANLGSVYMTMKDWKRAEAEFKSALAVDPSNSKARAGLREVESYLPPPTQYVIQVFSAKNPVRSENQKTQLAKAGLKPAVEQADIPERGRWYRVRLHGYATMKAALRAARKMLQDGVIGDYWVVKDAPKG
jgi:tetratricopeptide (TPR) repeat protein